VESSCEFGIEPLGSTKCWETIEWLKLKLKLIYDRHSVSGLTTGGLYIG
jgi:hypothetical protein